MWEAVWTWYNHLSPLLQAAMGGAVIIVCGATLGALLIVWQLGRQARQQSQHDVASKLRQQFYQEIIEVTRVTTRTNRILFAYARTLYSDVALYWRGDTLAFAQKPNGRLIELHEKHLAVRRQTDELSDLVERWKIVDNRLDMFLRAFKQASYDLALAVQKFREAALEILPRIESEDTPAADKKLNTGELEVLRRAALDAMNGSRTLTLYVGDFRNEMQKLLLGDFFPHDAPRRIPADDTEIVLRLDQYREICAKLSALPTMIWTNASIDFKEHNLLLTPVQRPL